MSIHPALAPALAEQHRRDLISQASACRQAQAARQDRPRNQSRRVLTIKALRATAAAVALAGAAFLATASGPAPAASAHGNWFSHYRGHPSTGTSYQGGGKWVSAPIHQAGDSHRAVLAVHWRTPRFGAGAGHVFSQRWA